MTQESALDGAWAHCRAHTHSSGQKDTPAHKSLIFLDCGRNQSIQHKPTDACGECVGSSCTKRWCTTTALHTVPPLILKLKDQHGSYKAIKLFSYIWQFMVIFICSLQDVFFSCMIMASFMLENTRHVRHSREAHICLMKGMCDCFTSRVV